MEPGLIHKWPNLHPIVRRAEFEEELAAGAEEVLHAFEVTILKVMVPSRDLDEALEEQFSRRQVSEPQSLEDFVALPKLSTIEEAHRLSNR